MKPKHLLVCAVLGLAYTARSQTITPFVVNSVGGSFTAGQNSIEFNVGEVATSTLSNSISVTQGLLQAETNKGGIGIEPISTNGFTLYPNPTANDFRITGLSNSDYILSVYDMTGKQVLQMQYANNRDVDLGRFAASIYNVTLTDQNNNKNINFKLFKTN